MKVLQLRQVKSLKCAIVGTCGRRKPFKAWQPPCLCALSSTQEPLFLHHKHADTMAVPAARHQTPLAKGAIYQWDPSTLEDLGLGLTTDLVFEVQSSPVPSVSSSSDCQRRFPPIFLTRELITLLLGSSFSDKAKYIWLHSKSVNC